MSKSKKNEFRPDDFVVYPAHGVGRIVSIEEQEVAGLRLEMFVISFDKDKMTLRVPTAKAAIVGLRKLADDIAADPHYAERGSIVDVGDTPMQNVIARLSATPGRLRWPGRALDADGDEIRADGWGHDG